MEWLSNLFRTPAGKIIGGVLGILICWLVYYQVHDFFSGGAGAGADARSKLFICSQTGKTFYHTIEAGDGWPVYAPPSGAKTGYPAELCYWNKDGTIKTDPTPVLLNFYVGKPEPTFCPDCGRLVRFSNPKPNPADKPPPTREEYERMHAAAGN